MYNQQFVYRLARAFAGFLFLSAALLLPGCATPQTTALLTDQLSAEQTNPPRVLPRQLELTTVPYYAQETNQCGPATLAMAMDFAGKTIAPEQLTAQVFLPGKAGSLQIEMLAAARRHGFIAYELAPELTDLVAEIAAGQPVIVLENLAFNWYPMWHYAVAIGYDLERGNILLRSGRERRQVLPLTTFEHTWSRSNYWAMLVLPPTQLPQHADQQHYLAAVLALEKTGQSTSANVAYQTALQRWPENLAARMGLGNTAYALGDLASAEQAFRRATQQHADAAVAFNNLADTLARLQRYPEALQAAEQAVRLGGEQQAIFAQTLAEIKTKMPPTH
jgi:hypothetical protein